MVLLITSAYFCHKNKKNDSMKKVSLLVFLSVLLISCGGKEVLSTSFSPVDYVNPLVGTQSKFTLSTGNTYPAVALPWGMNFWTPQTGDMGNGWAYCYTDDKIKGFKQTHQPSPWINDYGQFALMPVTGGKKFLQNEEAGFLIKLRRQSLIIIVCIWLTMM